MSESALPSAEPRLSIVIPAYNEEARLASSIHELLDFLAQRGLDAELLVVDDGSRDATSTIIAQAAADDPRVRAISLPHNQGKGAAIARGVESARGRYLLFSDADLPYQLEAIDRMLQRLAGGADLVIGARHLMPGGVRSHSLVRRAASGLFNAVVEGVLGLGIEDTQCGLKAFRTEVARALFRTRQVDGFGFDVELLLLAQLWGLRLEVLPLRPRRSAGSTVELLRHGIQMAGDLAGIWLRHRAGRYPAKFPGDARQDRPDSRRRHEEGRGG